MLPRNRGSLARAAVLVAALAGVGGFEVIEGARAQSFHANLDAVVSHYDGEEVFKLKQEDVPKPVVLENVTEVKTLALALIRLYQSTLSAQDLDVCNFHPSCSRFGAAIIHEAGFVRGSLLATDRLTRCHGLPTMSITYERDPARGRFADPVSMYVSPVIASGPGVE